MLKKTALTLIAGLSLTATASADIDLSKFDSDFNHLLTGLARDVAPTLRLGALSGDLQGDATIDHVTFSLPGVGVVASNGLGTILRPGAYNWEFVLPLADLVNDNVPNNGFERLWAYPSIKFAGGFGWNRWDFIVSGMWFPESIASTIAPLAGDIAKDVNPKFSFGNLGFQVRRTLIADSGWTVPAVSLGTGLYFTGFNLGLNLKNLDQLGIPAQTVGLNQTFDMGGEFGITTSSTVFTLDLHVSKHFVFLTPYVKLSGAYQNSTFKGNANLTATVIDDNGTPGDTSDDPAPDTLKITSNPSINVSDFAFLATTGLEVNLFICQLNINVVSDLGRAMLNLGENEADAISVNAGLRWSF